ncbi:MAG: rhomboid family intramembrane serine protease [Solirubrobacteraceae bacterium]
MASGPDLFVVCKSCGSEVSPYITECPYCGTRLRKRAPKLERGGTPKPPRKPRPRLAPLRSGEIPGIRPERRPYVTIALVAVAVLVSLLGRAGVTAAVVDLILLGPLDGEWWRPLTTQFVYGSTGYEVAALAAIVLFGTLLERRHGWWAPLAVFLIGGGAGMLLVVGVDEGSLAVGGNGAALALLAAWAMRDVLGRRQGREDESDLLGVLVIVALLVLLPVASQEAHAMAGLGGGVAGILMGLGLARLRA